MCPVVHSEVQERVYRNSEILVNREFYYSHLSYAKIISLTWYLLSYGVLYGPGPGGENSDVKVSVSWVDGTKPYLSSTHGRCAIVASLFLFVLLYILAPILLLMYPYLSKLINRLNWEEKWIVGKLLFTPLHCAVPFFDAIQGL